MTVHMPPPRRPTFDSALDVAHVAMTLRLADHSDDLLVRHVRVLRDCVALAQQRWGFEIEAAVVLPSEMQLLCRFADAQFGVGGAMKLITSSFSRHAPTPDGVRWSATNEVLELAPAIVSLRRTYIENAPVRAGLAKSAADWPYSSAHQREVQSGALGVAVA